MSDGPVAGDLLIVRDVGHHAVWHVRRYEEAGDSDLPFHSYRKALQLASTVARAVGAEVWYARDGGRIFRCVTPPATILADSDSLTDG